MSERTAKACRKYRQDLERNTLLSILYDEQDELEWPEAKEEYTGGGCTMQGIENYSSYRFLVDKMVEFLQSHRFECIDDAIATFEDTFYDYYRNEKDDSKYKELFRQGVSYAQELYEFILNEREEI